LRVVFISSQTQWGGGEQWLWSLGNALRDRGVQVHWIVPDGTPLAERLKKSSFVWLPITGKGRSIKDIRSMRSFLKHSEIELAHFNDSHAFFGATAAMLGWFHIPRVATKHTIFPLRSRYKYHWMIDRLVCVSKAAERVCLEAGLAASRISVVYGAVEVPASDASARGEYLASLGWPQDSKLIVNVGNLQACKGQRYLIEAMPEIRGIEPRAKLVIAGEGKERSELESAIYRLGLGEHVSLLGFRKDATRWLAAADVVVQPSISEALSLVAIESQMLFKPLAATAVGGLAEVIGANWERPLAEVLRPKSVSDIVDAVGILLQGGNEVRERCERAAEAAHERFSLNRMTDEVLQIYTSLLASRKPKSHAA